MAVTIGSGTLPGTGNEGYCEPGSAALRVVPVPRGYGFGVAGTTGTLTAATLIANSTVFAMRLDPSATRRAYIDRVEIDVTTLVAFTTPITAGRRLGLFRFQHTAAPTGGTSLPVLPGKHGIADSSEMGAAGGGAVLISAAALLTVTGTIDPQPFRELRLSHVGNAGGYIAEKWEMNSTSSEPIQLDPGQGIIVRSVAAFDAGGSIQMGIAVDWHEAPVMDSVVV